MTTALEEYLRMRGVGFEEVPHPSASSATEEARATGVPSSDVIKTIVVDTGGRHALLVLPASRRLDMHLVRTALRDHDVHLATEAELGTDFFGYELGAMPPLGSLVGAATYVDPEVFEHEQVVAAAGVRTESIRVRPKDLFREEEITVAPLASHEEEERAAV